MKYNLPSSIITNYMSSIVSILLVLVIQLATSTEVSAQIRPLDNGEITGVQKKGFQIDNYYSNNSFKSTSQNNLSTLLRYGIAKNYELQFGWTGQKDNSDLASISSESSNIGIKVHLTEDSKWFPALAAIVSANLTFDPTKKPFNPTINLLYEKAISKSWCINGNLQFSLDEQAGDITSNYSFNIETIVTDWQTTYIGLTGSSDPFQTETSSYQQYLEIGMLFWIYDGIVLFPFYDIGLNDSSGDIINIGALFTIGR